MMHACVRGGENSAVRVSVGVSVRSRVRIAFSIGAIGHRVVASVRFFWVQVRVTVTLAAITAWSMLECVEAKTRQCK